MARLLHVYLDPARVPAQADLQTAIRGLRFALTLDPGYVPLETQGYLPCTLEGEDAGVDLRFDSPAERPAEAGARATRITLRWGGDPREELTARMLAAAFAHDFDAWVIDPEEEVAQPADALLKQARRLHADHF